VERVRNDSVGTVFEGFRDEVIDLSEARLRVRFGGDGPSVLLVHGHPRHGGDMASRRTPTGGGRLPSRLSRHARVWPQRWYHWFFYAQPETPERVINADPLAWYRPDPQLMGAENFAELVEAINNPQTVRAMLEDYRAGLSIDREHDLLDRSAGRKIHLSHFVLVVERGRYGTSLW
jgi:hypothetical protein